MSLELGFRVEIQSDYHVGAGHSLGTEIDSALLRDADGVPVLRGTVLNGLLRDGLWRLLQLEPLQKWQRCQESGRRDAEERYCGQYTVGDVAPCPICRLFGTPRTMKRWRIGSARPVDRERPAGTPYKPEETASRRVTRVRVNPRTRRAAPRQLFSQEHGGQLTFTFTATCPAADEAALDEAALLVAAARFVRQLGRSRRRGQGECLISLTTIEGVQVDGDPQEWLLQRFEERWLKGEPQEFVESERGRLERGRSEPTERNEVRFKVLARADEPLLIAQRASAGNQFKSQPAITGKTLRGALAARAADRFDLNDETTYDAFIALFLRGGVRFPTLYPLFRSKKEGEHFYPAFPAPRDGFACKVYRHHSIQWGTQQEERIVKCGECGSPVKGVREEFFSLRELKPERFKPEMRSEMHIRVAPQTGRVEEGQLFEYVALEEGQYFVGELVCADEDAWGLLKEFTGLEEQEPIPLRVGKGTRRGYGQMTLWLERLDDEPPVWIQQSLEKRVNEDAELTLTLLTDAVVTDAWGRFVTGFEDGWLSRELGFGVEVVDGRDFAATRIVDGFNTQLWLPRWRDVVLAAGSSVRLRVLERPKGGLLAALARIEQEGIGLRRNEGYGQVAFNHPVYANFTGLTSTSIPIPPAIEMAQRGEASPQAEFRHDWKEHLADQPWERCQDDPFLALARWLDAHRHDDISRLLTEMEELGRPDTHLIERVGGEGEYGAREKPNRLVNTEGFRLVKALLERLQDEDRAHWPLGIRMLADRLAEVAGQKEEER